MNKKRLKRSFILLLLLAGVYNASAREFRLGLITPPSNVLTTSANKFAENLKAQTNGKDTVAVFPSGQLGNEAQMLQMLQSGTLDMAFLTAAEIANRVPSFGALYAPFLFRNINDAAKLLHGKTVKSMLKALPQKIGAVGVGFSAAGMRQILSRKKVSQLSDLKGQKIRITPVEAIKDFYANMGAAATPMPFPAVYDALANGQVDAIDMDAEDIIKLKYYKLAKTILLSNHMVMPIVGLVSVKTWKQLNNKERKQMKRLMVKSLDNITNHYRTAEAKSVKTIKALPNLNVIEPPKAFFDKTIKAWQAKWSKKTPIYKELVKEASKYK